MMGKYQIDKGSEPSTELKQVPHSILTAPRKNANQDLIMGGYSDEYADSRRFASRQITF